MSQGSDTPAPASLSDRSVCLALLEACRALYPTSNLIQFLTEFVTQGTITVLDADQLKLDLQEENEFESQQIE